MQIKTAFNTESKSSYQAIFGDFGYYIPPYQRPYSWGKDNISRLFEDLSSGCRQLLENENSVSFIGTIIVIKDRSHTTVDPKVLNDLPNAINLLVDSLC